MDARVVELRHLDDVVGSADLLPAIRKELTESQTLVRNASYSDATGRRLLTVTGELAQIAGWVASDAGQHADAQRLYLWARPWRTKRATIPLPRNCFPRSATILRTSESLTTHYFWPVALGDPGRAEPLLPAAVASYPDGHSREIALSLSWLAESCARTGALDAARTTLDRAKDYAARMPSARTDDRFRAVQELV
ncbi:hypothetical protein LX86_001019 [Lentzea aerocolonigenes]|nr:hypothetical protein [Lentzea aerocolonigenes]